MFWVKLHVNLRHNRAFRGLSVNAKVAFICGLMAAADYDQNGALCLRQRPLTEAELAEDLMLSPKSARLAIMELINMGFLIQRADGVLVIDKWDEKCGDDSFKENQRARQQRYRDRKHLERLVEPVDDVTSVTSRNVTRNVTDDVTLSRDKTTDIDKEIEIEKDTLRVNAREADALSDFLLAEGTRHGVVGEHRGLDPQVWRHHNREASAKLVNSYGLDACKDRAIAMFAAIKAGKIRNSGGQYIAATLSRVWEFRELQSQAKGTEDPLIAEFRRLG